MRSVEKLVFLGSAPILPRAASTKLIDAFGQDGAAVALLLQESNGFYAFEGSLHVFSDVGVGTDVGIIRWNEPDLWREAYVDMANIGIFFAEDIFGNQFCWHDGVVSLFDAETGLCEPVALGIEEWACRVLQDYNIWTGFRLAHDWQSRHGALPVGKRLLPKQPFVLGGKYVVENLYAADAVKGMRFRGSMAAQLRDVPDGSTVQIRLVD